MSEHNGMNVIELKQLLKILDLVKDQTRQLVEETYHKKGLTQENYYERRHELYQQAKWEEYEEHLL